MAATEDKFACSEILVALLRRNLLSLPATKIF
jgi:hypothetical protein